MLRQEEIGIRNEREYVNLTLNCQRLEQILGTEREDLERLKATCGEIHCGENNLHWGPLALIFGLPPAEIHQKIRQGIETETDIYDFAIEYGPDFDPLALDITATRPLGITLEIVPEKNK